MDDLASALGGRRDRVYSYIARSVQEVGGRFEQLGSAPNFQGDYVTLCTCKHHMRTFLACDDWAGTWVAGFTGVTTGAHQNDLVYLMRIGQAFPSHADLWDCVDIPETTKEAKAADDNVFGDVFRPKSNVADAHSPGSYVPPTCEHSHWLGDAWHKDVHYRRNGRAAALLVGDPRHTFIWDRPMIHCKRQLYRGQSKWTLCDLIAQLED